MTRDNGDHNDFHETPGRDGTTQESLSRLAAHELWSTRASVLIRPVPASDAVVVLLLPVDPVLEVDDGPISYAFDGSGPDAVLVSLALTGLTKAGNDHLHDRAARLLGDRVWAAARSAAACTELILSPEELADLRPLWAQEAALQHARHELDDDHWTASVVHQWTYSGTMTDREAAGVTRAPVADVQGTMVCVVLRIEDPAMIQAMTGLPLRRGDSWPEIEVRRGPADTDPLKITMVLPALRPDIVVDVVLTAGGTTHLLSLTPKEVDGVVELSALLASSRVELEGEIGVNVYARSR